MSAAGADVTPSSSEAGAPTVAEQWQAQHGVTLLQPQLPCLDVGSGPEPEWVPAELCRWVLGGLGAGMHFTSGWGGEGGCMGGERGDMPMLVVD